MRRGANAQRQQQQTQRQQEQQQRLQNHQQQQLHQHCANINVVAQHTINNQVAVGTVGAVLHSVRRPISEMWERHQRQSSPSPPSHSQSAKDCLGRPAAIEYLASSSQVADQMDVEVGDWAAASSGLQVAKDDDAYALSPPPRRETHRSGARSISERSIASREIWSVKYLLLG